MVSFFFMKKIKSKPIKTKLTTRPKSKPIILDKYLAVLNLGGVDYKSEGETIIDALKGISAPQYKLKGLMTIQKGGKKVEKSLSSFQVRRFFKGKEINKMVLAKILEIRMR